VNIKWTAKRSMRDVLRRLDRVIQKELKSVREGPHVLKGNFLITIIAIDEKLDGILASQQVGLQTMRNLERNFKKLEIMVKRMGF